MSVQKQYDYMLNLEALHQRALSLYEDATQMGLPAENFSNAVQDINRLKKQLVCKHSPVAKHFITKTGRGIVWICEKCDKIIDIETKN